MKVLINAISLHTGGAKVLGLGITQALRFVTTPKVTEYIIIAPKNNEYKQHETNNIRIVECSTLQRFLYKIFFSTYFNFFLKKYKPSVVLNLCNMPIKTSIKQFVFLHQPYILYPDSPVWKMYGLKNYIYEKQKVKLFSNNLKFAIFFFVQTSAMINRLVNIYNFNAENVFLSFSVGHFDKFKTNKSQSISKAYKVFLYPTRFYPHKNIAILIKVARLIQSNNLNFKIVVTMSNVNHPKVKQILAIIKQEQLENVFIHKGFVYDDEILKLYQEADALIMPTLLETLGFPYLEAMYMNKPIFTSNLDFARCLCQESAVYFDPMNANDILEKMRTIYDKEKIEAMCNMGKKIISQYPTDWKYPTQEIMDKIFELTK